ncbi:unnamed protein product [Caenorhabditis nigoni]
MNKDLPDDRLVLNSKIFLEMVAAPENYFVNFTEKKNHKKYLKHSTPQRAPKRFETRAICLQAAALY